MARKTTKTLKGKARERALAELERQRLALSTPEFAREVQEYLYEATRERMETHDRILAESMALCGGPPTVVYVPVPVYIF